MSAPVRVQQVGSYGFTCGYCETMLDTPFDDHEPASKFAQEQGWRMTFGFSPRWGEGANNTCPNCAEGDKDAIPMWLPSPAGGRQ